MSLRPNNHKPLFPDEVILRTDNFTVSQDWEVPIKGFYILASATRRRSIIDFNEHETLELLRLQRLIRHCMKTLLGISDVYFFQNEDSDHAFHIWIFPRHSWMDRIAGRKIQSVRPIMDYAVKHATKELLQEIHRTNERMREYLSFLPIEEYLRRDLLKDDSGTTNFWRSAGLKQGGENSEHPAKGG
jgi:diadenosine tetraphosphate (Ap4A) HIT family hydrolase